VKISNHQTLLLTCVDKKGEGRYHWMFEILLILKEIKLMNIKPLGNRIVVKRTQKPTSKGGILLPESAQEKPREGEVVAVGPGKIDDAGKTVAMEVKVGDLVLFGGYAGTEVKSDNPDEELLILSEDEVLGLVMAQR